MLLAALRARDRRPELMDDPALPADEHRRALAGLARINRWTNSAGLLWNPLKRLASGLGRPLKVLDVATGSGDLPLALARRADRAGIPMDISGCDISPTAVATAAVAARVAFSSGGRGSGRAACAVGGSAGASPSQGERPNATSVSRLHFFTHDALRDPLPTGYDAVTCSLFVHHLDEPDAVRLFANMKAATNRLVLASDLARGRFNFLAVWLTSRVLSRSRVVHTDGPLSVRAAFTVAEMRTLAEQAGLTGATVTGKFPCRQLLTWEKT